MKRRFKATDIFKPGTFPVYTYVSRQAEGLLTYEQRLEEALDTPGFLTSIVGPSKSGKTVLCEKVIPADRMVLFSGADFKLNDDFWMVVARKLGLPIESEYTETTGGETQGSVSASAGIRAIFHGTASAGGSAKTTSSESTKSRQVTYKDRVIQEFLSRNLVMVLDDFHYIEKDMRMQIAYQLKDAIRHGLKAIVIALPHRADDAIRENPDLNARMSFINIDPWAEDELEQIPTTGFRTLGVDLPSAFAKRLSVESLTSPQLAQNICLNLARIIGVDTTDVVRVESENSVMDAFWRTTLNTSYADVVKVIQTGPPTRGQKRGTYNLGDRSVDIYALILETIAKDPPVVSMSLDDLRLRIDNLLGSRDRVDRNKIRDTMNQIQSLLDQRSSLYQVLEWKDQELYVLDPYFLFYLRWTRTS